MARSYLGLLVGTVGTLVLGCGGGGSNPPDIDAAMLVDAGMPIDAGPPADAGPSSLKCLTPAERGAVCTLDIHATLTQYETASAPAGNLELKYNTAWDVPQVFPTTCTPLAMMTSNAAMAMFTQVSCSSPAPFVVTLMADDPPGGADDFVLSINDRRLPATVPRVLDPFRVFVLSRATFNGWKASAGLSAIDWSTHGLAVVTFRDSGTAPVQAVRVFEVNPITGSQRVLRTDEEVFYLGADGTTLEPGRMLTSASGTVLLPLFTGQQVFLTGQVTSGTPIQFEARSGVSTAAGAVFFEQIDPR